MRSLPKIVGICAAARHGKDTLATELAKSGYFRISLADELKEEVARLFPMFPWLQVDFREDTGEIYYPHDTQEPELLRLRRRLWQTWGTEARRQMFPDFWLWRWSARVIRAFLAGRDKVFVADVRFPNEGRFLVREIGGILIGSYRMDSFGNPYREAGTDYTHDSEKHIPEVIENYASIVIKNNGTYENYKEICGSLISSYQILESAPTPTNKWRIEAYTPQPLELDLPVGFLGDDV